MSDENTVSELANFILRYLQEQTAGAPTAAAVPQSVLLNAARLQWSSHFRGPGGSDATVVGRQSASALEEQIATALNALLRAGEVQLVRRQRGSGELMVQLARAQRKRLAGLTNTERAVYEQIRAAGEHGIWVRHIRGRLGLPLADMNRTLKELQRRELVKQVQSIRNKTRKLYMLAELEPSREVTGGPFYDEEGTFDHEFIHRLRELVWRRLLHTPWTSALELTQFLNQSNVLRFSLEVADLEQVLQTMCWDLMLCRATEASAMVRQVRSARGDVTQHQQQLQSRSVQKPSRERCSTSAKRTFFYACLHGRDGLASVPDAYVPPERLGFGNVLSQVPCSKCPVRDKCSQQNPQVNARLCPYMEAWSRSMCT